MKSIRHQLKRDLVGVIILLLSGGLIVLYFAARDATTEEFDDLLDARALAVSGLTAPFGDTVSLTFNDHFFQGFDDDYASYFVEVWDADGRPLARSESLARGQDLPLRSGPLGKPKRWNLVLPNGHRGRAVGLKFQPKPTDGRTRNAMPLVQLVVASDREDLDETLWRLLGISAASGAVLVLATLWVIPRVLKRGLKPLEELGRQATAIDASSLATRFPSTELPAELQPIAARWNELLGRLEASFERERRFSADLAHELRTPVSELRSLAECALKWPHARDPATDTETLAIARQMEALVTHILALGRGEQGQQTVHREGFALAPFIDNLWRACEARAAARGLRVSLGLSSVQAWADPALLRSILVNLCENAVEYTPPGGALTLVLHETAAETVFCLGNTTDELHPDDVAKIFDRFWRKDLARTGGQHFGLGLSLARNFAEMLGGSLTASLDEPHRIVFRLALPRSPRKEITAAIGVGNVAIIHPQ
ncbi:MAG: ATP-binding protein [Opitutus sp.]